MAAAESDLAPDVLVLASIDQVPEMPRGSLSWLEEGWGKPGSYAARQSADATGAAISSMGGEEWVMFVVLMGRLE
jgi:hypothetical protein